MRTQHDQRGSAPPLNFTWPVYKQALIGKMSSCLITYHTKGKEYNEEKIHKKLYGAADKNAFYRLRGRLQDVICQNLALLHETKNDKNKLLLYFSVYHIFFDKGNFDLAFTYLLKAERLALYCGKP